jgi:secernin
VCDCLVALPGATAGPFTLFAKNSDRPPVEVQHVSWSPPRRDTGPLRVTHIEIEPRVGDTVGCLLSRPAWCWGAEHGVNEAGVAMGNVTVYTTLDPRGAAPALIGMDLVRLALERATTAEEAVEVTTSLLERYGQGGSGHHATIVGGERPYWSSFLVADTSAAWVLDTSGDRWMAERVRDVRAISNRTSVAGFDDEHRHPRQPVERLVDPRWRASTAALGTRPVTVESLAAHLRSHDSCAEPGWSVCMHVDGVEATTASMIAELRGDGAPHRAWVLTGSPCENEYTEVLVRDPASRREV